MTRLAIRAALALTAVALAACSHYRLGTGGEPAFNRLFIAPVKSEALVPQAKALVATQLREAFIKDGRVALADAPGDADATLEVTLSGYRREPVVSQEQDTGLTRRFDVTLTARATLTDLRSKKVLFQDRQITARRGILSDSGLQQADYQNLPLLAEILATDAVHAALDTW